MLLLKYNMCIRNIFVLTGKHEKIIVHIYLYNIYIV